LHAVAIGRELHIPTVIVPRFPSHFSALGMLMADERHDFIRTYYAELEEADFGVLASIYREMAAEAEELMTPGISVVHQILLDLRYVGQEFDLTGLN
jgi:N-methylhydantoinase A